MQLFGKTQATFTDPEIEFENAKGAKAWGIRFMGFDTNKTYL
jgi:hypothetical protein